MRAHLSSLFSWIIDASEECRWPLFWISAVTSCIVFLIGIALILVFV